MATKPKLVKEASKDRTFTYEGIVFTIPEPNKFPLDAVEAMEDGRTVTFIRALFGEAKYAELRTVCHTVEDLEKFANVAFESLGADPKE